MKLLTCDCRTLLQIHRYSFKFDGSLFFEGQYFSHNHLIELFPGIVGVSRFHRIVRAQNSSFFLICTTATWLLTLLAQSHKKTFLKIENPSH